MNPRSSEKQKYFTGLSTPKILVAKIGIFVAKGRGGNIYRTCNNNNNNNNNNNYINNNNNNNNSSNNNIIIMINNNNNNNNNNNYNNNNNDNNNDNNGSRGVFSRVKGSTAKLFVKVKR